MKRENNHRKNHPPGATNGAGTAYPYEAPGFNPSFLVGFVLLDL
jgi:hypothetical protein